MSSPEEQNWEEHEERWTAERLCRASYKDLGEPYEVENKFLVHLLSLKSCRDSLHVLLTSTSTTTRDYSLEIDAFDLLQTDPILGHLLLRFPSSTFSISMQHLFLKIAMKFFSRCLHLFSLKFLALLTLLENAIVQAQKDLQRRLQEEGDNTPTTVKGDKGNGKGSQKTRVHARLVHLPPTCCRASVASMEASDIGKIVQLSGTVVRAGPVQMYESSRTYKCTGKKGCSRTFVQRADLEQRTNALLQPSRCPLIVEGGKRCQGTNLQVEKDGSFHTDYQEIKIQEGGE
jgi:DNA replicative helicase MCM subunit Mcm2 (Cdc46/Mcm family)